MFAAGLALGLGSTGPARADSAFLLPGPVELGSVAASTYDAGGHRLGPARLVAERVDARHLRVAFEAGGSSGPRIEASALLVREGAADAVRVVRQRSESFDSEGHSLGRVEVDHVARRARCRAGDGAVKSEIQLDAADRVMNVPMNLFFRPLLSGEEHRLAFQTFLCRGNARLLDFEAWLEPGGDPRTLEVRYGPDFGFASGLARRLAPRLSFWFASDAPYAWRANRLPLYSGGPEVTVVRAGVVLDALR